jgi:hypothetical protein
MSPFAKGGKEISDCPSLKKRGEGRFSNGKLRIEN